MEHKATTTIPVPPDRLDRAVRRTDAEHVEVEAECEGRHEEGQARFRDDDAERVGWGSDAHAYSGWMQVEPDGEVSRLTPHSTAPRAVDGKECVASTFDSIRKQL